MKIVSVANASLKYASGEGLREVNLEVHHGEFVFLVGPSGAGKSSVLKLIFFAERTQTGVVQVGPVHSHYVKRKDIVKLRRQLGIVFQNFRLLDDRSVFDNIAFVLRVTGMRRQEIKRRVLQVLAEVGISHKRYKMPYELSGGEQQRVAIARAIANEPLMLLADEPTGNLDSDTADEILALLEKINLRGTAVLMATHNYNLVKKFGHRVVRIDGGVTLD